MEKLVALCKAENSHIRDYEVLMVDRMDMLSDDEDEDKNEAEEDFDDRDVRTAMRNKKDYELFIGSLPPNADERELAEYFRKKKVKITNIRVLRSILCLI